MRQRLAVLVLAGTIASALAVHPGCGTDEIWNCENSTTTGGFNGTATLCDNQWICDTPNGALLLLDLRCTGNSESFQCACSGNGQPGANFSGDSSVCGGGFDLATKANEGCDWSLPEQ